MYKTFMTIAFAVLLTACTNVQGSGDANAPTQCECCKSQCKCCGDSMKPGQMCPMKMKGMKGKGMKQKAMKSGEMHNMKGM